MEWKRVDLILLQPYLEGYRYHHRLQPDAHQRYPPDLQHYCRHVRPRPSLHPLTC